MRLFVLKLLTTVWFVAVFSTYLYLVLAMSQGWWPFAALAVDRAAALAAWFYCAGAGGLGATVYAARGFYWAVGPQDLTNSRYQYDPNWTWWYFLRPLMGSVVGLVGYVALRVILTPVGVGRPESESALLAFAAVSFAAGFSLTTVLNWLDQWSKGLFAK